jgi:hypothetical protein
MVISAFLQDGFSFYFIKARKHTSLALFLAASTTMTLGALYEIEEYIEDVLYHTHRSGLGHDTPNDLLLDFLGVALVILSLKLVFVTFPKRFRLN